jgi:hypothetical protein
MPSKRSPERVLAALLRRAVLDHAASERRQRHVPILHVGIPGEPHEVFALVPEEVTDQALRSDIVAAMRRQVLRHGHRAGTMPMLVWLTRSGDLELQDLDAAWHAAARQAFREAADELHFAVVCRRGWRDLGSGALREWARVRPA